MPSKYASLTLSALLYYMLGLAQSTSLYTLSVDSISGNKSVSLSSFKGKTILFVNYASLDLNFSQVFDLQRLQQQYKSGLVVMLIPSNDFGKEPATNEQISALLSKSKITLFTTVKMTANGTGASSLLQWLTQKELNGVVSTPLVCGYQKFLVNGKGQLVQSFDAGTRATVNGFISETIKNLQ